MNLPLFAGRPGAVGRPAHREDSGIRSRKALGDVNPDEL